MCLLERVNLGIRPAGRKKTVFNRDRSIQSKERSDLQFPYGQITESYPDMPNPYQFIPLRGMIR